MASSAPRYAQAFAQVARSSGLDVAAARQQLADFAAILAGSVELRRVLDNPSVEQASKVRVLDAVLGRIGALPQVRNFVAVIVERGRLNELDQILAEYGRIADRQSGAVEARVISAHPLDADSRALLEERVAALAGAQVRASYEEDASLLGGAIVEIGSTVYDGSVRAQLERLRQRLVNA